MDPLKELGEKIFQIKSDKKLKTLQIMDRLTAEERAITLITYRVYLPSFVGKLKKVFEITHFPLYDLDLFPKMTTSNNF